MHRRNQRPQSFPYDAVGNRQNNTNTAYGRPAVSDDYTYNAADQLVSVNSTTHTYDLNGNLASKIDSIGTTTYAYNYDDRLVQVRTPNSELIAYTYDADGNRTGTATSTGAVKYLVDTNRSLPQVLAEYTTAGVVITSYVYADDLISMKRSNAISYYHFDGLGSTRLLTDATGTTTDAYEYDAFGNQIARTGTTKNEFLFTGQQYDANLGFYYLRARYYQPDSGRFTALDPYQGDPYAPATLHKYLYAANDPINKIDPSGQFYGGLAGVVLMTGFIGAIATIVLPTFYSRDRSLSLVEGAKIVGTARTWIGVNYEWGGSSRQGIDCSHLVWIIFRDAGFPYPYTETAGFPPAGKFKEVSSSSLQEGDVVLFSKHMGIYTGGKLLSARSGLGSVDMGELSWYGTIMGRYRHVKN